MAHFTQLPNEILIIIFKFVFRLAPSNEFFDFYNLRKISPHVNKILKTLDAWEPYTSNLKDLHKKAQSELKDILQENRINKNKQLRQLSLFLSKGSHNEFFANIAIRDERIKQLLSEKFLATFNDEDETDYRINWREANAKSMDRWQNWSPLLTILDTLLKYESTAIFSLQDSTFRKAFLNKNFLANTKKLNQNYIIRCGLAHEFIATYIFHKDTELREIIMESSENIVRCALAHESIATYILQKDIELMQVIMKTFKETIRFISAYKEIFVLFSQKTELKQAFLNFLKKTSKLAGDAQLLNIGIRFEVFSKEQADALLDAWEYKSQEQIIDGMIDRLKEQTAEPQVKSMTMTCCR